MKEKGGWHERWRQVMRNEKYLEESNKVWGGVPGKEEATPKMSPH